MEGDLVVTMFGRGAQACISGSYFFIKKLWQNLLSFFEQRL